MMLNHAMGRMYTPASGRMNEQMNDSRLSQMVDRKEGWENYERAYHSFWTNNNCYRCNRVFVYWFQRYSNQNTGLNVKINYRSITMVNLTSSEVKKRTRSAFPCQYQSVDFNLMRLRLPIGHFFEIESNSANQISWRFFSPFSRKIRRKNVLLNG